MRILASGHVLLNFSVVIVVISEKVVFYLSISFSSEDCLGSDRFSVNKVCCKTGSFRGLILNLE